MLTSEEYEAKHEKNLYFTGHGVETKTHMPCPGCAEPDFAVLPVTNPLESLTNGAKCIHCGRAFRVIVFSNEESMTSRFEVVQTEGEDLPPYLQWIRRI